MSTASRGLLAGMDIDALRARTTTEPHDALWGYYTMRWDKMAARRAAMPPEERPGYGGLAWHGLTPMMPDAALIHCLTCRDDALAYVQDGIECALAEFEEWTGRDDPAKRPMLWDRLDVAFSADLCRASLGEDTLAAVRAFMAEAIRFQKNDVCIFGYQAGNNVNLSVNVTAALCALLWGEESGVDDWRFAVDLAVESVKQYVRHGSDADGFWQEGSCYGIGVYSALIYPYAQILRQATGRDLFDEIPALETVADACIHLTMPDYVLNATTGDGSVGANFPCWTHLLTAKNYDRPDHLGLWHAIHGPDHEAFPWGDIWPWKTRMRGGSEEEALSCRVAHPDLSMLMTFLHYDADAPVQPIEDTPLPTAIVATGTGTATFRTSWQKDATFAILLGGGRDRACHAHAHADCGHFGISVGGEYLAIDTGRYNTNEDQHNVVLIDGESRFPSSSEGGGMVADRRSGRFKRAERHGMLDRCTADATHMKDVIWALREFFFVRLGGDDAYVLMLDNINVDNKPHTYHWQLNAHPEASVDVTGANTATVTGEAARLDCSFFQKPFPPGPDIPHEIRMGVRTAEWVWPYGRDVDMATYHWHMTVTERPCLVVEQDTLGCLLASVVVPRREGQGAFETSTFRVWNGLGIEVKSERYVDRFYMAPDHAYIACADAHGPAEFAMERRTHDGELVDRWVEKGGELTFGPPPAALQDIMDRVEV